MQVHELARELGMGSKELADYLGKPSHKSVVEEHEATIAREHFLDADKAAEPETKPQGAVKSGKSSDDKIVRFWSEIKNHSFTSDKGIIFLRDWHLDVIEGSFAYNAVIAHHDPNVRIVVDKPFESVGDKAEFSEFLHEKVYTGRNREPALIGGLGFLSALFRGRELEDYTRILNTNGIKAVIQYAVDTKSWKAV